MDGSRRIVGFQILYGTGGMTRCDIFVIDGCRTQAVVGTCKIKSRHRRVAQRESSHVCFRPCFGEWLMIPRQRLLAA
jgi:hypothetical protein